MTPNIVQNVSLPEEEPCQGEAGLCHEGQLQVRKNLLPDQSMNVQVCSFTSYKWKNHFYEMNGDVGMAGYKV